MSVLPLSIGGSLGSGVNSPTGSEQTQPDPDEKQEIGRPIGAAPTETPRSADVAPVEPSEQSAPKPEQRPDDAFVARETAQQVEAATSRADAQATTLAVIDAAGADDDVAAAREAAVAYQEQMRIQGLVDSVGAEPPKVDLINRIEVEEPEPQPEAGSTGNATTGDRFASAGDNPLDRAA